MKQTFWKADWYAGLVISPLLLLSGASVFLQRLWRKACDLDLQASSRGAATEFAIIAIAGQSIANIGRWSSWLVSINRQSLPPYLPSQAPHLMIANEPHVMGIMIDCMLEEMSMGIRCMAAKSLGICTWDRRARL